MATLESLVEGLRAAGEPTRLRLMVLLARAELTVSELTSILKQSQPRVSRHLKLLTDAGLIDRHREGAWVFYRAQDSGDMERLKDMLLDLLAETDPAIQRDLERLDAVRAQRAARAQNYFSANAAEWNRLRALHVAESDVEAAIMAMLDGRRYDAHLDIGTGTGRILELVSPKAQRSLGVDLSPEMLAIARSRLAQAGLTKAQVRLADLYELPSADRSFDLVTIHQVLHYLDDPQRAVAEAARVLRPGGRLLVVDFAPHAHEALREEHQHRRLGFAKAEVEAWLALAGLHGMRTRELPSDSADGLTVSLWIAARPTAAAALSLQDALA
jgi:ArsR family transcriptional regulator